MIEKISKQIIQVLTFIPGIASFANIDFESKSFILKAEDYEKSFRMSSSERGKIFSLAIIVNRNTRAKIVCREIVSHLTKLFKDEKVSFSRINIYIRGVH